jgi:hypothetical protein
METKTPARIFGRSGRALAAVSEQITYVADHASLAVDRPTGEDKVRMVR